MIYEKEEYKHSLVAVLEDGLLIDADGKKAFLTWEEYLQPDKVREAARYLGVEGAILFLDISEALAVIENTALERRIIQRVFRAQRELDKRKEDAGHE